MSENIIILEGQFVKNYFNLPKNIFTGKLQIVPKTQQIDYIYEINNSNQNKIKVPVEYNKNVLPKYLSIEITSDIKYVTAIGFDDVNELDMYNSNGEGSAIHRISKDCVNYGYIMLAYNVLENGNLKLCEDMWLCEQWCYDNITNMAIEEDEEIRYNNKYPSDFSLVWTSWIIDFFVSGDKNSVLKIINIEYDGEPDIMDHVEILEKTAQIHWLSVINEAYESDNEFAKCYILMNFLHELRHIFSEI